MYADCFETRSGPGVVLWAAGAELPRAEAGAGAPKAGVCDVGRLGFGHLGAFPTWAGSAAFATAGPRRFKNLVLQYGQKWHSRWTV